MIRGYFDLDEILCNEAVVTVTFTTPVFAIGKTDIVVRNAQGERQESVEAGHRAQVPIWVAIPWRQAGYAAVVSPPPEFVSTVFREFKIDPLAPNLYHKNSHYYALGYLIAALLATPNEGIRLKHQLMRLFQSRYYPILLATSKKGHDFHDLRDTCCDVERQLLDSVWQYEVSERKWAQVKR